MFGEEFFERHFVEDFAAIDRLIRVFERFAHPQVHTEIEVAHDEHGRLNGFGDGERLPIAQLDVGFRPPPDGPVMGLW